MDDPQHEHKKDFLLGLRSFRPGAKRKMMPVRHSFLAARTRSTGSAKPSLQQRTKTVESAKKHPQPDHPEFRRSGGAPLRRDSGAKALRY